MSNNRIFNMNETELNTIADNNGSFYSAGNVVSFTHLNGGLSTDDADRQRPKRCYLDDIIDQRGPAWNVHKRSA